MNDDKIIEMAKQAGDDWEHTLTSDKEFLVTFARLIEAATREECAKMVDDLYHEHYMRNIRDCAAAIREMK